MVEFLTWRALETMLVCRPVKRFIAQQRSASTPVEAWTPKPSGGTPDALKWIKVPNKESAMHHRTGVKSKKNDTAPMTRGERRALRKSERDGRRHQNNQVYELPDRPQRPSFADRGYLYDEQNTSGEFERGPSDQGYGSHYQGGYSSGTYDSEGYGKKQDFGAQMEQSWRPQSTGWRPSDETLRPAEYDSGAWNENHSGKGPKGYVRSDERIREQICDLLMDHPDIDASDIEIEVAGGEVTLKGTVVSRDIRRLTEDVVHSLGSVKDVHNLLKTADRQKNAQ